MSAIARLSRRVDSGAAAFWVFEGDVGRMNRFTPFAAAALACAFAPAVVAGKQDIAGYTTQRAALASSLPIKIVVLNTRVQSQVGLVHRAIADERPQAPDLRAAAMGAALTGGLLPALAIAAAERQKFHNRARDAFAPIKSSGCDLRIDQSLPTAVSDAMRRSPSGASASIETILAEGRGLDRVVEQTKPRQVLSLSSSLAPDLEALVTTLEINAYAQSDGAGRWQREPVWRDELIVVSDVLEIPSKTQADIDMLAGQERARYEATGNEEKIRKLNAQGGGDRFDRKLALDAQRLHERNMEEAVASNWPLDVARRMRAQAWSTNGCARMQQAIDQAGSDLGRMLDGLYAQQLPPRLGTEEKPVFDDANGRHPHPLPGGIYVYRVDYDQVPLGYRQDLLKVDD
ncbi:hypothetical protein ACI2IY_07325 [Lysobacter enzymogenes]|uniref:hypothetical protein n=1 Tax=Lysobacter enzymogenes TaxID=69 RepID=UPI00384B3984